MREIKFRVWDTSSQEMHKVNNILFSESAFTPERITAHIQNGQYNISGKIDGGREDAFKLMQYTGLKDKNGVEIYEGDVVVRNGYPWFDADKPNYRDTIEWIFAGFHTVHNCVNPEKCGISDGINEPLEDGHGWEVIGNIYENPELLGEQS